MDKEQRSRHLERVFRAKDVAGMTPQGAEATLSIGYLESGLTGFMAYDLQQVWSKAELVVSVPGSVVSFPNHEDCVVVIESGNSYTVTSGEPNSPHMYTCAKKCVNFKRCLHFCKHTLAAAETAGHLEEYLAPLQLETSRETLQSVIERSRNQNALEKSKKKRKGLYFTLLQLMVKNQRMNCKGVPDPILKQITLKYIKTQNRKKEKEHQNR